MPGQSRSSDRLRGRRGAALALIVLVVAAAAGCRIPVAIELDRAVIGAMPRETARASVYELLTVRARSQPPAVGVLADPESSERLEEVRVTDRELSFRAFYHTIAIDPQETSIALAEKRYPLAELAPRLYDELGPKRPGVVVCMTGTLGWGAALSDPDDWHVGIDCLYFRTKRDAVRLLEALERLRLED